MFCSECGAKAAGKFCSSCGARLTAVEGGGEPQPSPHVVPDADAIVLVEDWSNLLDYQRLIAIPEVRDLIAASSARSKKPMSGEQFLELCDKAIAPLLVVKVPFAAIAQIAQPLSTRLGMQTGKARSQFFTRPPGDIMVALLCSLARRGRTVRQVHQAPDGCAVEAALPSDLFALEGDLLVTVTRHRAGTHVEANTLIKGQLFDWGKSSRCLEELFGELSSAAAA